MKRRNVVMGVILASVLIAAIVIQATFGAGVGGGIKVEPTDMSLPPNSMKTFTIILQSPQSDNFDVTITPGTCDRSWFAWLEKPRVRVEPRVLTQLYLNVRPTELGNFYFKVTAESRSGDLFVSGKIRINTEPTPTPTPTPTPSPSPTNKGPKCIGLEPNLPSPQKISTISEKKDITWSAFACDPDGDTIDYRFCVHIEGLLGWNCTSWSTSNKWVWHAPLHSDYQTHPTASYDIIVDVRDATHADDWDSCVYHGYQITVNEGPKCACLIPEPGKFPPQSIGTPIKWTACALDPEGEQDKLWYMFWVDDEPAREWNMNNTWTWTPTATGTYDIMVWVRDDFVSPLSDSSFADKVAIFERYKVY